MKENKSRAAAAITALICALALVAYPTRNIFSNLYLNTFVPWTVWGKVTDITNTSPVDLAEINIGSRRTFSVYDGSFNLAGVKQLTEVKVVSPDFYEEYSSPLRCVTEVSWQKKQRLAVCDVALYPTAENVAIRVEINLSVVRKETDQELQNRNASLWELMEPESRKLFGSRETFIDNMVINNLISQKLKRQELEFKVVAAEEQRLAAWQDPISGIEFKDVAELPVVRTFASGTTRTVSDRLVRVDGIWRYIPDFRLSEIQNFNNTYGWVLKVKDW